MAVLAQGIDVSHWQGNINWNTVKNQGFSFVMIKAGGADNGYYKDSRFDGYYTNAKKAGMKVGAYYFTGKNFYSADEGRKEAQHFCDLISGKQFEYPVAVDIEAVSTSAGKQNITDAAIAFCSHMEKMGYYVTIYASEVSGFKSRLDASRLTAFDKWVAKYSTNAPSTSGMGMWQYGGSTNYIRSAKVNGVSSSACDQDFAYRNYPSIIRAAGLNGLKPNSSEPNIQSILIKDMSSGDLAFFKNKATELGLEYEVQ